MRWLVVLALATRVAHADAVDDLEARGEELAKTGEYSKAIAAFKQAELQRPKAVHACMIGLAYLRRELWPQAELFFATCHTRATPADQLPDWIVSAEEQLAQRIADAHVVPVTIQVVPADAGAMLSVSSFPPDELFPAQDLHLAPGTHSIEITAHGYPTQHRDITIEPGKPITLVFTLQPPARPARATPSPLPTYVMIGGAGLVAVGVGFGLLVFEPKRDHVITSEFDRPAELGTAQTERAITIGCIAAGAIAAGVGYVWHRSHREAPAVGATVTRGGAAVVLEWRR